MVHVHNNQENIISFMAQESVQPLRSRINQCPFAGLQSRVLIAEVNQLPVVIEERIRIIYLKNKIYFMVIVCRFSPWRTSCHPNTWIFGRPLHLSADVFIGFSTAHPNFFTKINKRHLGRGQKDGGCGYCPSNVPLQL